MVHGTNSYWMTLFQQQGVKVVCWNYRNYGESQGKPDPIITQKDSEEVFKFAQKLTKGKIGVFGRSLGGSMATHVASKFKVDLLFVDRSFGNLNRIVKDSF